VTAKPGRAVVLFDWGETLMWIPGMIHDPDKHLACVGQVFDAELKPHFEAAGVEHTHASYTPHYLAACKVQIKRSKDTQREHTFADRFAMSFAMAGVKALPPRAAFERMAQALGEAVTAGAVLLDHAADVIPELAASYRLGVVSNYPQGPVVGATLERFGLRRHFEVVVVSSETQWMKPHPDCYRPALDALDAVPERTLMVGDDLRNDVKGAKALGLRTAWLAPGKAPDPDADIHMHTLAELPAFCRRIFS
jgi:HAD superfamily hydrolase (TIGR01549 family)